MPLSPMGIFHTILGIVALYSGFYLLLKLKQITFSHNVGKIYLISTLITAASALTIFKHGGPNAAHALAVLTIVAALVGIILEQTKLLKGWNKYVVATSYSATILFHLIPTATEILTRFPMDAPTVSSLEDPILQQTFLGIFILFVTFLGFQMNWLRKQA